MRRALYARSTSMCCFDYPFFSPNITAMCWVHKSQCSFLLFAFQLFRHSCSLRELSQVRGTSFSGGEGITLLFFSPTHSIPQDPGLVHGGLGEAVGRPFVAPCTALALPESPDLKDGFPLVPLVPQAEKRVFLRGRIRTGVLASDAAYA